MIAIWAVVKLMYACLEVYEALPGILNMHQETKWKASRWLLGRLLLLDYWIAIGRLHAALQNRLSEAAGCTLGNAAGKLLEGCLSGEPTKNRLIDFDIDGMALCCSWGGAGLQLERAMADGRLLDVCWVATQRLPVHLWKVTEG